MCGHLAQQEYLHPDGWIFRCLECTHAFTDPSSPFQESYNEAYFAETHRNWFRHPNLDLFRRIQGMIRAEDAREGLLDVGCGRGDFVFFLEKNSPDLRLAGLDLAPLPDHPRIDFTSTDLFAWEPGCAYAIVTSLAVIEHVPDIRAFLEKLRRFLKKDGRMVLMTLNEDSYVYMAARGMHQAGLRGPFERLYSRHHRHHFTQKSLRRLVENSGMRVLQHFTHNFPLAALDFPSRGVLLDAAQKAGVAALFGLGKIPGRGFLQTLVCRL